MKELPLPPNPFITEGDPDSTSNAIQTVLAFLRDHLFKEIELNMEGSLPSHNDHLCGQLRILEGIDSAVEYLSRLEAIPNGKVTKLEVKS